MSLDVTDLKRNFRIAGEKKCVLDGINLNLNKGDIVSITGRSGCGKTTLFNIISGLLSPSSGQVLINGRKIRRFPDILTSRMRNREIGFIFQTFRLINEESVYSNILLPAGIKGFSGKKVKDYADELMGRLNIYKYRKTVTALLSGGQKQRVAIARALINRPSVILADEPTANLDKDTSKDIYHILASLKDEGRSVVVVTHSDYMHSLSDRSYIMEGGRLRQI